MTNHEQMDPIDLMFNALHKGYKVQEIIAEFQWLTSQCDNCMRRRRVTHTEVLISSRSGPRHTVTYSMLLCPDCLTCFRGIFHIHSLSAHFGV